MLAEIIDDQLMFYKKKLYKLNYFGGPNIGRVDKRCEILALVFFLSLDVA